MDLRLEVAELISLGLTVPTLVLSAHVVLLWRRPAVSAVKKFNRTATDWFVMGVAVGFAGSFADNLYWTFPWTASFLEHPCTDELMSKGVYFNIFSRQLAGIFSAYCHIRSYFEYRDSENVSSLNRSLTLSALLGCVAVIVLMALKR